MTLKIHAAKVSWRGFCNSVICSDLTFVDRQFINFIALLDAVHHILSTDNFAENCVMAIQMRLWRVGDEELRTVGSRAGVGHGKRSRFVAIGIAFEFIGKLISWTAGSGSGWVAALDHEVGNDAVKYDAVIKPFASQEHKIVHGLRRVVGEQRAFNGATGGIKSGSVILARLGDLLGRVVLFRHGEEYTAEII